MYWPFAGSKKVLKLGTEKTPRSNEVEMAVWWDFLLWGWRLTDVCHIIKIRRQCASYNREEWHTVVTSSRPYAKTGKMTDSSAWNAPQLFNKRLEMEVWDCKEPRWKGKDETQSMMNEKFWEISARLECGEVEIVGWNSDKSVIW